MGSPPPTRGTRKSCFQCRYNPRITPAYAGNTDTVLEHYSGYRDHPRLRGEHYFRLPLKEHCLGSPPPTRGTLVNLPNTIVVFRITPAYAGNTLLLVSILDLVRDHPRLRGEHCLSWNAHPCDSGSPPPTRGTHLSPLLSINLSGITPAYAGNTINTAHIIYKIQDHPRLRGEHT